MEEGDLQTQPFVLPGGASCRPFLGESGASPPDKQPQIPELHACMHGWMDGCIHQDISV